MKCNFCNRKVRDSFMDKLNHLLKYHPDKMLTRLTELGPLSFNIGANIAEQLKGVYGKTSRS